MLVFVQKTFLRLVPAVFWGVLFCFSFLLLLFLCSPFGDLTNVSHHFTNNVNKRRQDIIDRIERWFKLVKKDFINWNDNLNSFVESQIVTRKKEIEIEAEINMAINNSLD